jgi:hypothetical protein
MSDGQWQLTGTAAELFERYLVPAITAKWAEDLLDRAQPRGGEAILDIACGTGIVARLAAKRMGRGLETLFRESGFNTVAVQTVEQTIVFPSVLDYVRFQLLATPMTVLLRDQTEPERTAIISSIAARTIALSTPAMLEDGRFTFPQEAYVAIARRYP